MNQRDLELLSAYLDGELTPSDSARLESRLNAEPGLAAVLADLRATRTLLRRLPKRRAPRNFTLTRKMVGLNPPLPRSYPAFRLVTAVATLLFFFTFGINALAPQLGAGAPAFGFGGAAAPAEPELFSAQAPATEAPAFDAATEAPAATEPPFGESDLAPLPTAAAPATDGLQRVAETPSAKTGEEGMLEAQSQPEAEPAAVPIPRVWPLIFAAVAMLGTILMAVVRRSSINRWK
jgi:anti-sigma factor RsiW